jgi:hypothetical protein
MVWASRITTVLVGLVKVDLHFSAVPVSANREAIRPDVGHEELDLEAPVGDWSPLTDPLARLLVSDDPASVELEILDVISMRAGYPFASAAIRPCRAVPCAAVSTSGWPRRG